MSEKAKIQQIVADWKKLDSDSDKNAFLEKLKTELEAKDSASLLAEVKAIGEVIHDLHTEIFQPSEPLRHTVEGFFSTVDDLIEKGKLTFSEQVWLEKELAEMELKLKAYKQGQQEKVGMD